MTILKKSVLFLCNGNSARSLMAEAILKKQAGNYFDVFSAGSKPNDVDPIAMNVIKRHNMSTEGLYSKHMKEFKAHEFDFVISLCNKAKKKGEKKNYGFMQEVIEWNFEDPKTRQTVNPYETTFKELNERIKMFVLVQTKDMKIAV
ncbi:arsenate reductase ArsC [Aliikangiella marina]|uniref:Arsenate reductase ArsC n=1 Tax=Aliikangiella marina TaxID=1712262 RepID=A0A545TJA0_9GAMM|nr:arsenate reductase ArsC [Aliikangiella marina]TQV77314.1 arsenate reductase ArsC [Aliikangiella marina]